jgi:hypothetical protein
MKISELKQVIPVLSRAGVTPFLWGSHGIGKTESVEQIARENGLEFFTLNLGTQEVGDLLGLPDFSNNKTEYKVPSWFPTDPDSKGILFLDEINRARRDVLQAVFSLVLSKRLHDKYLPKGWSVVVAGNPYNKDYVVTDVSDAAFMSRFCHLKVTNDLEEWAQYATSIKVPSVVTTFALEHKNLFSDEMFEIPKFQPKNRNLVLMGQVVAQQALPDTLLFEVATGILGMEAGVAFMSHTREFQSTVKGIDVLKKWDKVKDRVAQLSKDDTRMDVLNITCNEVHNELKAMNKVSDKVMGNFREFMKTLPKELSASLVLRIVENSEEYLTELVGNDAELVDYYKNSFDVKELHKIAENYEKSKEQKAA